MSERDLQHTEKCGVETADGWYAHRRIKVDSKVIDLPIKLDFTKRGEHGYQPLRRNGNLVYSMIGGGEVEYPDTGPDAW